MKESPTVVRDFRRGASFFVSGRRIAVDVAKEPHQVCGSVRVETIIHRGGDVGDGHPAVHSSFSTAACGIYCR